MPMSRQLENCKLAIPALHRLGLAMRYGAVMTRQAPYRHFGDLEKTLKSALPAWPCNDRLAIFVGLSLERHTCV